MTGDTTEEKGIWDKNVKVIYNEETEENIN
jgi:hypothetical protein